MNRVHLKAENRRILLVPCALLIVQLAVFLIFRENSYLQVHDNLDLFMAHYRMIGRNGAWFAHGVTMPMLHGISRDLLGSEWNLYNMCYILLPGVWAYLCGYFLKQIIGFFSFLFLAKTPISLTETVFAKHVSVEQTILSLSPTKVAQTRFAPSSSLIPLTPLLVLL